jgi:molybdopterin-guanine dinucleotide biosynthesis protein A
MNLSAVILAGGESRRMGRDKAWLELEGQPMLDEFWAWRAKRKKFCRVCFGLDVAILLITPILRFN